MAFIKLAGEPYAAISKKQPARDGTSDNFSEGAERQLCRNHIYGQAALPCRQNEFTPSRKPCSHLSGDSAGSGFIKPGAVFLIPPAVGL